MADAKVPSNWQLAINGEWHGCPSLFEHDGTHVGTNKVSRASEFKDGRTTYWMDTRFDATGPLMDRFEIGSRMEFGVIDSDQDRIYTGPDFMGSGRPFGLLVDSNYYSPGWNVNLRTVNHVVPELGLQVYSSQLFEADTLVGVFNGLYVVTQDHASNPATQKLVADFIEKEKIDGKKPFNLPVKHEGVFAASSRSTTTSRNWLAATGSPCATARSTCCTPSRPLRSRASSTPAGPRCAPATAAATSSTAPTCTATASPTAATCIPFATYSARPTKSGRGKRWWTRTTPWFASGSSSSPRKSSTPLRRAAL